MTAGERRTLENMLVRLDEADQFLDKQYSHRTPDDDPTPYRVRKAWNAIWYCQGRLRGLLLETLTMEREGK